MVVKKTRHDNSASVVFRECHKLDDLALLTWNTEDLA